MNANNLFLLNTNQPTTQPVVIPSMPPVCAREPFQLDVNCDPVVVDTNFEIDLLCSLPSLPDTEANLRTVPVALDVPFIDTPNCIYISGSGFTFRAVDDCAIGLYELDLSCPVALEVSNPVTITQDDEKPLSGKIVLGLSCDDASISLELNIPCPISVALSNPVTITEDDEKPLSGKIAMDLSCDGDPNLALELNIPCPVFVATSSPIEITSDVDRPLSGKIAMDLSCDGGNLVLELNIPIPSAPSCPIHTSDSVPILITQINYLPLSGKFAFDISCDDTKADFELNIPCPVDIKVDSGKIFATNTSGFISDIGAIALDIGCDYAAINANIDINKFALDFGMSGCPLSGTSISNYQLKPSRPSSIDFSGLFNISVGCDGISMGFDLFIPCPVSAPISATWIKGFVGPEPIDSERKGLREVAGILRGGLNCSSLSIMSAVIEIPCASSVSATIVFDETNSSTIQGEIKLEINFCDDQITVFSSSLEANCVSSISGTGKNDGNIAGEIAVAYNECDGTITVSPALSIPCESSVEKTFTFDETNNGAIQGEIKLGINFCDDEIIALSGFLNGYSCTEAVKHTPTNNVGKYIAGTVDVVYNECNADITINPALSIVDLPLVGGNVYTVIEAEEHSTKADIGDVIIVEVSSTGLFRIDAEFDRSEIEDIISSLLSKWLSRYWSDESPSGYDWSCGDCGKSPNDYL